ncbi:uncharacterized protein LOC133289252 [Gastrolobium bilobum]|uniref:uncharacterized protein LOC133289252 n=1 Tax=Gastrolobium bilobum TaxID=150636 RepID=UPI002AAF1540|nr:uncharacterized protein LOC133289252 [Gastrolobium bilobum]
MAKVMMHSNVKGRMDRDEDLTLFRELRKRQNERISSLMHCASEDYECDSNGKVSLYKIPSGKKEYGLEFLETNKNDYDWLKTPPATPLFPSLEMEPSAQLVTQKEIPISQPISRFAWSDVEAVKPKAIDGKANHTNSTKAKLPLRSVTPSHNRQRPSIIKNINEQQSSTHPTITNKGNNAKTEHDAASNTKSTLPKHTNNADFLALNLKKSTEANESQRKPKPRGVSPSVRSRVKGNIVELSNEAPPNLRTDQRSSSTTRGRSTTPASTVVGYQNQDPTPKACRPSRSPSKRVTGNMIQLSNEAPPNLRTDQRSSSTTRGRSTTRESTVVGLKNQDPTPRACRPSRSPSPSVSNGGWNQLDKTQKNLKTQKDKFTLAAGDNETKAHFRGSKMVEKVVNARKSGISHADKETKSKPLKYRV